jgi:hypothetical protein
MTWRGAHATLRAVDGSTSTWDRMNEERDVQMTPQEAAQELLARLAESGAGQSVSPALWIRDELADTWRAARDDAGAAYGYWSQLRTRESYAIYQAAQDRVDAAQDALACWADAAGPPGRPARD